MAKTPLAYIRSQVQLPGENFIQQWNKLTDQDKADLQKWAVEEMALLNVTE